MNGHPRPLAAGTEPGLQAVWQILGFASTMPKQEQTKNKLPAEYAGNDCLSLTGAFSSRLSGKGHNPVESL
jgi:hypothetical protein